MLKVIAAVSVLLIGHTALTYSSIRSEVIPTAPPLTEFPKTIGSWTLAQEGVVDAETQAVLQADDTLTRVYAGPSGATSLFIAAFRSQRNGKAPHSPKNCLPGSGWVPSIQDEISVPLTDHEPITVNRYIVARGDNKSLVLYWYQSRERSIASEYSAKFYVIADAIKYNRTDTALVRIIVPLNREVDEASATKTASEFVRSIYPSLRLALPS